MGLRVPVGTLIYRNLDMSNRNQAIEDVRQALLDAGWEAFTELNEQFQIHVFNNPNDGDTLTIGATTYTYRNTPTLTNDIQIAASITLTRDNTVTKINAVDPLVTAQAGAIGNPSDPDRFILINDASGIHDDIVVSEVGTLILNSTVWQGGGYSLLSVVTAEHKMRFGIELSVDSFDLRFRVFSRNLVNYSRYYYLDVAARTLKMSVDGQEFETWFIGSSTTAGCTIHLCAPFVFPGMEPLIISSVADNGSGEFRITLDGDHGLATGQDVYIDGATKSSGTVFTALNGTHLVTVISDTVLDLDASVFASGYDADSGLAATNKRHARCFFAIGCIDAATNGISFRNNIECRSFAGERTSQTLCLDDSFFQIDYSNINGATSISLFVLMTPLTGNRSPVAAIGGLEAGITPIVGWRWPDDSSFHRKVAHLPGALVIEDDIDMDATFSKFGYNWINLTHNHNGGALVKIITPV